mgnify:CR=1 FL=1|jgi:hypothetical protein
MSSLSLTARADYEGIYEITSSGMTHCLNDHFPLGFGHGIFNAVPYLLELITTIGVVVVIDVVGDRFAGDGKQVASERRF